jgi:predicted DNA-binding protein (MmcQ/YjbR family)
MLKAFALSLPEAVEDVPWGTDTVAKVNKKIFVFLGAPDTTRISVKLPESGDHALSVDGAVPTSYGLGRHGWVTVPIQGPRRAAGRRPARLDRGELPHGGTEEARCAPRWVSQRAEWQRGRARDLDQHPAQDGAQRRRRVRGVQRRREAR